MMGYAYLTLLASIYIIYFFMCALASSLKSQLILLFSLFLLLFMALLHFLVLFIDLIVLFQPTFTIIYSIFSKKISISIK